MSEFMTDAMIIGMIIWISCMPIALVLSYGLERRISKRKGTTINKGRVVVATFCACAYIITWAGAVYDDSKNNP